MFKKLWLVGKWLECETCQSGMEMQGIFTDLDLATASCITKNYFVVEMNANEALPDEKVICRVAWYPMTETREEGIARFAALAEKTGLPLA